MLLLLLVMMIRQVHGAHGRRGHRVGSCDGVGVGLSLGGGGCSDGYQGGIDLRVMGYMVLLLLLLLVVLLFQLVDALHRRR